ncbi:hypothetical protein AB0L53_42100 [Nonomuraea sp. NPDC052129]|uniref:hypothetical protein n=1 Tax=Nonomuraea sp. NPDC052129 TaxID=3154651 RepID=UPI00343D7AE5
MSIPATEPTPSAASDVSQAADLRVAARWLVGSSASVVALLVVPIQLRNFSDLTEVGPWAVALALLGFLAALASVVWTLYSAAAVLAVPRRSIGELAELDRADNSNYPDSRVEPPTSALITYLVDKRRADLLGSARDAVWQLATDMVIAHKASMLPRTGEKIQIGTREYDLGSSADNAALATLVLDLERRAQRVVDAAAAFETQQRYERLAKGMKLVGAPFAAGFLLLLWLQTLPAASMAVKTPTSVQIVVPASGKDPCRGKVLEGVAVGGTMDAPVVVIPSQPGCPARKLTDTDEFIVIPRTAK